MSDPIEWGVRFVLGNFTWHALGILCLVVAACFPNFLDRPWRERERRTLAECRVLSRRVLSFLPVYELEVERHARSIAITTRLDPLVALARVITPADKVDAEKRFCVKDSSSMEAIALLQMELNQVLRHNKEA
jgi:hypothetical protein